jgi:hypothetical protein
MNRTTTAGACFLALGMVACGSSSTSSPTSVSVFGNYSGTLQDSAFGVGTIQLTLSQSGSSLTGTYEDQFTAGAGGGSITGTVNGVSFSATLTPGVSTVCPVTLTGTINNGGSNISGTYSTFHCSAPETGSFNLTIFNALFGLWLPLIDTGRGTLAGGEAAWSGSTPA